MTLKHQLSTVIVTAEGLPSDRMLFDGVKPTKVVNDKIVPLFSTGETAKVFFAQTPYWLRWREREGDTVLDGKKVKPKRSDSNIRQFNLADIEKLAHALRQNNALTTEQFIHALRVVQSVAVLFELV